jgi:hypothetical protein
MLGKSCRWINRENRFRKDGRDERFCAAAIAGFLGNDNSRSVNEFTSHIFLIRSRFPRAGASSTNITVVF